MELNSNTLNKNEFLKKIHFLRKQKGKYFCMAFCFQLENMSNQITEEIYKNFGFRRIIYNRYQCKENLSSNFIDLCLECIEIDLQKIQPSNNLPQTLLDTQSLQILIDIADDLQYLATYIKCTISINDTH